jgi:hypothetical protein
VIIDGCSVVTVIIDGCFGFKEISLRGFANLKNLLLRGVLHDLFCLDISGSAIQTLDLSHYWIRLLCREPGALGKGLKALGKAHDAVEERQS